MAAALSSQRPETPTVISIEHAPVGDDVGLLSTVSRATLTYATSHSSAPESVIVKIEPAKGVFRTSAEEAHAFSREIRFYTEVAPALPMRVPRYYYGNVSERGGVLVLEDLTHLHQHDQIIGLPNDRVLQAVQEIAKLHARFWGREEEPAVSWMLRDDDRLWFNVEKNWPLFKEVYSLRLGPEAIALAEWLAHNIDTMKSIMAERTHTLCHGDFRADNLLYGEPGSDEQTVVIDWQLSTLAMGALDIARLVGGSEPEMERRNHHLEAVGCWHDALLDHGVRNYAYEQALQDFRLAAIANLAVPIRLVSAAQSEPGRIGRLVDAMAERLFASALEIDASSVLP